MIKGLRFAMKYHIFDRPSIFHFVDATHESNSQILTLQTGPKAAHATASLGPMPRKRHVPT